MIPVQARLILALGAGAVLLVSHWYSYDAGYDNGNNAVLVKQQQDTIARLTTRIAENEAQIRSYAEQAHLASQAHANELQTIRAAAERTAGQRVRILREQFCPRPAGTPEGAPAGSTGQDDAGAAFLPDAFAADLRQLAAQADEVSADLRTLKQRSAGCFQ